jgi:hypothetical protein
VRIQLTTVLTDMTTVRNQSAGPAGTMAVPGAEEVGISPVLEEDCSKRSACSKDCKQIHGLVSPTPLQQLSGTLQKISRL